MVVVVCGICNLLDSISIVRPVCQYLYSFSLSIFNKLRCFKASIAGIISQCRSLTTRKGAAMAVVTLEDRGGTLEAVIFPESFGKYRSLVEVEKLVVAQGKLEKDDESARLIVSELGVLEKIVHSSPRILAINITTPPNNESTVEALAELFGRHPGTNRVSFNIELRAGEQKLKMKIDLSQTRVRPSEELVAEVERLCGKGSVSWL